jgi:uncharacterized membrane protein
MKKKKKSSSQNTEANNEKLCAVLSYLYIGLLWYLLDEKIKKSEFAKYHVKQGLVLLITNIVLGVIMGIPIIGWFLAPIIYLIILALMIVGIINALANSEKELPVIGKFAENFKF